MIGYYDDGSSQDCKSCNIKCKTCKDNENNCTECELTLPENQNRSNFYYLGCPCLKFFYENILGVCKACFPTCNTCAFEGLNNYCTSCISGIRVESSV